MLHRRFDDHPLRPRIDRLPTSPGVYLMKDSAGRVLYVGKAVNLRARVRSYFNGTDGHGRRRMHQLMGELDHLDISLAADEREALLLEARLIRQHQPKYNIALKNGFRSTCIRIDLEQPFPRLECRPRASDGARYFGPLPSEWHANQILSVLERHFPVRTCDDQELRRQKRPCLQYQLKRCMAPCAGYVTAEAYREMLDQVMTVLEGGEACLAEQLRRQMGEAAGRLDFEQAALIRDRLRGLEGLQARTPPPVVGLDRDVIGLARIADEVAIAVVPVRWVRQQQARVYYFDEVLVGDSELLSTFLLQQYQHPSDLPLEIGLPFALPEYEAVRSILVERAERPLRVSLPPDPAGLEALAAAAAEAELASVRGEIDRAERGAEALARLLRLERPVRTLEWLEVDLGARRAWRLRLVDGTPEPGGSARHALRTAACQDLTSALELVFQRLEADDGWPDVLVLEGGKAALGAAAAALRSVGRSEIPLMSFPTGVAGGTSKSRRRGAEASIGSEQEAPEQPPEAFLLYLPGRRNALRLPPHSPARRLVQLLREAGKRHAQRQG